MPAEPIQTWSLLPLTSCSGPEQSDLRLHQSVRFALKSSSLFRALHLAGIAGSGSREDSVS